MSNTENAAYELYRSDYARTRLMDLYKTDPGRYDKLAAPYSARCQSMETKLYNRDRGFLLPILGVLLSAEKDDADGIVVADIILQTLFIGEANVINKKVYAYLMDIKYPRKETDFEMLMRFDSDNPGDRKRLTEFISTLYGKYRHTFLYMRQTNAFSNLMKNSYPMFMNIIDGMTLDDVPDSTMVMIAKYKNDSWLFRQCMGISENVLLNATLMLRMDYEDVLCEDDPFVRTGMMIQDRRFDLNGVPQEEFIEYFKVVLTEKAAQIQEDGIDVIGLIENNPVKKKDVRNIVNSVFINRDNYVCAEISDTIEFCTTAREIINRYYMLLLERDREKFATNTREGLTVSVDKEVKNRIKKLHEKNKSLQSKVDGFESEKKKLLKKSEQEVKALRNEIAEKAASERKMEKTIEELKGILDQLVKPEETIEETERTEDFSEEDFISFINEYNIAIWGARDSARIRLEQQYPDLTFIASNSNITRHQLSKYDGVIVRSDYTSHGNYWGILDTLKRAGIPAVQMWKNTFNEKHYFKAAGILEGQIKRKEMETKKET